MVLQKPQKWMKSAPKQQNLEKPRMEVVKELPTADTRSEKAAMPTKKGSGNEMTNGPDDQKESGEKLQGIVEESKTVPGMEIQRISEQTAAEAQKSTNLKAMEVSRPEAKEAVERQQEAAPDIIQVVPMANQDLTNDGVKSVVAPQKQDSSERPTESPMQEKMSRAHSKKSMSSKHISKQLTAEEGPAKSRNTGLLCSLLETFEVSSSHQSFSA